MDKTSIYNINELKEEYMIKELLEVICALEEKEYDAVNQISGYLLTGDESYITNFKNSRSKILKYKKSDILSVILKGYLKKL